MTSTTLSRPAATAPAEPSSHTSAARRGWTLSALVVLLIGTGVLYLWDLSASGYGNSFYAAAVQAGTRSWKALLFGSLDAGNSITVDKPPAALWVMALSGRIFGFNSWSLLVPQALEGVAAVALLHATLKRRFGPVAGLLGGLTLALTPVAVLMFRFDNPDALLVLLLVAGAYCTTRALEKASAVWLSLAAAALGFAFLTKMGQGVLVLPGFALAYLVAAPTSLGRRLMHLVIAGGSLVVSAGWFVALVALWPAGSRPYIGGSTDNSLLELALGYNGLGRILGGQGNGGGGGGGGGGFGGNTAFGGATGVGRLFGSSMGTEISWLLPAALIALVAGLWFTRRAPRTDLTRAALIVWGGWLLVTGVVFSYMSGTIHPYYTIALAPAIGALVAIGGHELWRARAFMAARLSLAFMLFATGVWDFILLNRTPAWHPWLRWLVLAAGVLSAALVALGGTRAKRLALVTVVVAVLSGFTGSAAYALSTAGRPHTGPIPSSGPVSSGMGGGFGGGRDTTTGTSSLTALLEATDTRWAAATTGDQTAAELELASGGKAVIAIGGWSGSDPSPTLAQFEQYVQNGEVRYFIAGGGMGGMGGGNSAIATWVAAHYTAQTVGGSTVYDLTKPTPG